jgi:hypothetical protein
MVKFSDDTYCSFCYMPGAKHQGGAEIGGKQVSGVFCNEACFKKWLRWKQMISRLNLSKGVVE